MRERELRLHARPVPAAMRRALAAWHRVECVVVVAAFGAIALLLIADVVGRELLWPLLQATGFQPGRIGIQGAGTMAAHLLVIGSFAGIGVATARGNHLVPRVGFRWVPARWAPGVVRAGDALSACLLGAAAWFAGEFVRASYATGAVVPMLGWQAWPVQLAIPFGFASAALRYAAFAAWPAARPNSDA